MPWSTVLVASSTGLLAGIVGSLGAPWVHWSIAKRRETRDHRRDLLTSWRGMLAELVQQPQVIKPPMLLSHAAYVTLRPHLSEPALSDLERSATRVTIITGAEGISASHELRLLAREIDRLEVEWGLK